MRLCCIFNYAPHYRLPIFKKMDTEMGAYFYFGSVLRGGEALEKLDYSLLHGFRKELETHFFGPFEWTSGWLGLPFRSENGAFLISKNYYALNQWLFLVICKLLHKPVYAWMHGMKSSLPEENGSALTMRLARWYDRLLTGTFLYGQRARENMVRMGYEPSKLHVIYNSLDYDKMKGLRNVVPDNPYQELFGNGDPVLLFIGRLTAVKELDSILEVHKILKEKGLHTNVVFIGDGPEKERLCQAAAEDVGFVGALYDEKEIHPYLYHADLCLSPGNVGLTAIHCLSYGLPVVTNDGFNSQMPEYEAIEPGITGDFFKKGDVGDFASKVSGWLSSHDGKSRESVREACLRMIDSRYNPDYQICLLKSVIKM